MNDLYLDRLLKCLCENNVEFVIIGGVAGALQGLARATFDLDIAYRHTRQNCEAIANALMPLQPYLRGAPPGLPFVLDAETLYRGCNFTLTTTAGAIDILGDVPGSAGYEDLLENSESFSAYGCHLLCVSLDKLIILKRAAGRPRDFEMLGQLESLKLQKRQQ